MDEINTYDHLGQISGIGCPYQLSPAINIRASLFGGFNTFRESLSHSPQGSIGSECWSPSPPGTASPSRSSPSYGTSPYDFGVDFLLDNIRQAVNGLSCDRQSTSANDTQNRQDRDYTNLNSEICAKLQDTNSNNKVDEVPLVTSSALVPSSSQMVQYSNPSTPTQQESHYCRHTSVFYCHSCNKTLCSFCEIYQHQGHTTMNLIDASRLADIQSNQTLNDIKFRIAKLQENLIAVQKTAENLEYNASEAKKDVSLCIEQARFALRKREEELYKRIDEIRDQKFEFLKFQDYNLKNTIKQLLLQSKEITNAKNLSNIAGNPVNFFITREGISSQILKIEKNCLSNVVVKDNWISFSATADHVLGAISNLGRVKLSSLGLIGDGRFLKGRGNFLQVMCQQNHNDQLLQIQYFNPRASGRPVPSVYGPVIVNPQLPEVSLIIKHSDAEPDLFPRPWGVACDKDGNIIVTDRAQHCVRIFNQNGTLVKKFGIQGTGPGQFFRPAGVAVDEWRRIIVADKDNHRIQMFTMEGEFILAFGKLGKKDGEFDYPWDVATNTDCQIVVTDTRNYRVQLFSSDGVFLRKFSWGNPDRSKQSSYLPRGIAFNPQGEIVVTDLNKSCITIIRFDMLDARVINSDNNMKKFERLQGITIDDEGNMIVSDSRNYRIVVLDSKGDFKYAFGNLEEGPYQMNRPAGIALTPEGRIVVVDFGNNRVVVY
ncbi:E3 ubiquitin-protein ligase TRIM71 [Microplitis demolitor]|uniref:E3 ubiquitin-protein ligase TRIM71 n=1 Tax=Microplitis demolitor TaxID=69319 RepID=UPI0004CCB526|nr:E3 ubiquitin-protein ligase TRIM71 [Microplitis demolitor]